MTSRTAPFNGRHMTAILVAGFGVVIAVNVTMASLASSTFGGILVENSYVASQDFNRWLDEAAREKALGWRIEAHRRGDGLVVAHLAETPSSRVRPGTVGNPSGETLPTATASSTAHGPGSSPGRRQITAIARHPLGRLPDVVLTFREQPGGDWLSTAPLPAGRWTLRFEVEAQGETWRMEEPINAGAVS